MNEILCRACGEGTLKRFLELGGMPPVNAFLDESEIQKEKKYPLNLAYCPKCLLVQIEEIVPPEELFSNYLHLSSASVSNINHLKDVADTLNKRFDITSDTSILEIGSNDATLLGFLKQHTDNLLGVDPAKNLAQLSREKGIETLTDFFNTRTAEEIVKTQGLFDIIVALNVIPHTPDVVDLLRGVKKTLSPDGTLVMEGAYALETVLQGEFDTIYHEHVYSFSLHSLISTFDRAGLKIVDVEKIPTQGGSLRIFAKRKEDAGEHSKEMISILDEEKEKGLNNRAIYDQVENKVKNFKTQLKQIIENEKRSYGKLIALGSPARGIVITNYCKIGKDDIDYMIDDTPLKQGKYSPGMHVPIKSWNALDRNEKRTFLLLSWNYKDHLIKKLKENVESARVIIPFPKLEVQEIG
ncbi:class I SAM-dependent methyltransferase [Candidatus Pacearchaeota archaeon]|nr:class I SAM-dependent methyltransferase [Candidatus Pacearchaeota archaeon]